MKTLKKLTVLLFVIALMQPLVSKAQAPVFKAASVSRPAELWEPISLDEKGSHMQNGVEFYKHNAECNSEQVNLVKLVNKNNYSAKIAYQSDANSPVQYVRVPAMGTIEGSCSATDPNLAKLIIHLPQGKTEDEMKKFTQFIIASIVVSEMK